MKHSSKYYSFFNWLLKKQKKSEQGFTLTENLVAFLVITTGFIVNLQFIVALQIRNLQQEIQTAAVSEAKLILDDIRFRLRSNLDNYDQGRIEIDYQSALSDTYGYELESRGFEFDALVHVCTNKPTISDDRVVDSATCSTTGSPNVRYVVVQIIDRGRQNETLYTSETVFTPLR